MEDSINQAIAFSYSCCGNAAPFLVVPQVAMVEGTTGSCQVTEYISAYHNHL